MKKDDNLESDNDRLRDLGSMTAILAHEIRNPLGGIKGFASLLRKDLENEPDLRQMAEFIMEGADHLNRLVTHILNFAHPLQTQFKVINVVPIAQKIKKTIDADEKLKNQIINQKISFKIKTSSETIDLSVDEDLLFSALFNLAINAIQAMPHGGDLSIAIEDEKDHVKFEVIDTGIGIPRKNLEKIFTAFFTTKQDGNGFGLLEVHKVVKAHKGSIDVNSTVNEGTCFTIKIPKKGTSYVD